MARTMALPPVPAGRPAPLGHVPGSYGVYVSGTSMDPELRPGDVAYINPRLPVIENETYIFYAEAPGSTRATIKRLRWASADTWHVTQHNPAPGAKKDFTLDRREWQHAHRVIGKLAAHQVERDGGIVQ